MSIIADTDFLILTSPTATLCNEIEYLVRCGEEGSLGTQVVCKTTARALSVVVFPIFLFIELVFKKIPQTILASRTDQCWEKADDALKYLLAIVPAILLGFYSPEGVPGFFLKRGKISSKVVPFGVENIYGKKMASPIVYPQSKLDVVNTVQKAIKSKKKISIIGAGFSQGTQTIPNDTNDCIINTKYLNEIKVNKDENTVTVGAGATWEQVQLALDKCGKSPIVKQASDPFSIGGSIGINCHGWAHQQGSIAQTVRSLKVVDAQGNLLTLQRPRKDVPINDLSEEEQLFKCMFGTLGYFGVVVEATLDIIDNTQVTEFAEEVNCDQFVDKYEREIKNDKTIPLFGGRLTLDSIEGHPLRNVCMVSYKNLENKADLKDPIIHKEASMGARIERIALRLISGLPTYMTKHLLSWFWRKEKEAMFSERVLTLNQALHPPINAFNMLHHSNLHTQWLQEYFIKGEKLASFLKYLGFALKANDVKLINATIRPTPKDDISILPYAEEDRYAVVICFAQTKTKKEIEKTKAWIENINEFLERNEGIFYQAYMPYATKEQFETCYGKTRVAQMRAMKKKFDPNGVFSNAHTKKYFDEDKS